MLSLHTRNKENSLGKLGWLIFKVLFRDRKNLKIIALQAWGGINSNIKNGYFSNIKHFIN